MFTLVDEEMSFTWAHIELYADPGYTEYQAGLGPVYIVENFEDAFFPLQWTRVCLSLDSISSKVMLVVDGQLLGEKEYRREEDLHRPAKISLVLGFDPDSQDELTGRIAGVNIFNSSLSLERMIIQTTAGFDNND